MKIRVVIAADDIITRMDLKERLVERGYIVVGEASDGIEAIEQCRLKEPDLTLMDIKMPLLNGLDAAKTIYDEDLSDCIVMISAYSDKNLVDIAGDIGVMGYIVKPFRDNALFPAIEIALKRCEEMTILKCEMEESNRRLNNRIVVDKAKGILMQRKGMTEESAYQYIRNMSMDKRKSMKDVAEMIIMSNEIL